MTVQDLTKTLRMAPSSTTNNLIQDIVANIIKEHPTHQASIIRNLSQILIVYSQSNLNTDGRNSAAKSFCDKVQAIDQSIPYI
jgi:Ca2+-binding EF-hand superfamily protein